MSNKHKGMNEDRDLPRGMNQESMLPEGYPKGHPEGKGGYDEKKTLSKEDPSQSKAKSMAKGMHEGHGKLNWSPDASKTAKKPYGER